MLPLYREFLREHGALVSLMSGSGSTTFAVVPGQAAGEELIERFKAKFGHANWAVVACV